jgi:hypothetical protein
VPWYSSKSGLISKHIGKHIGREQQLWARETYRKPASTFQFHLKPQCYHITPHIGKPTPTWGLMRLRHLQRCAPVKGGGGDYSSGIHSSLLEAQGRIEQLVERKEAEEDADWRSLDQELAVELVHLPAPSNNQD